MALIVKDILLDKIEKAFDKLNFDKSLITLAYANKPEMADYQCNSAFSLAKKMGKNPVEIATAIVNELKGYDEFEAEVSAPAFINIKLKDHFLSSLAESVLENEKKLIKMPEKKLKVLMDYGGANVAKELHIGHLRSPIIGEALYRLYKLLGHEVISDTHLGDWGLQMGLTIAQLEDDGYLEGYFKRGKNKQITLDTLNEEYPKASKRKNVDAEFKAKADKYTVFIQKNVEPYFTIYNDIRELSVNKIKENYKTLGCTFDLWYGESTAYPYINKTVQIFKDKGLARESEGALVVDVAREGENIPIEKKSESEPQRYKNPMPPVIIKKYNDADVYATTDLATILMRNKDNCPDKVLYIVDFRQSQHFTQVFRAAKLSGIAPENQELVHIAYGTINGKDGKAFKTRSGETIKLEDIINLIKSKAEERLAENGITDNSELAMQIGISAMKYGDLSNVVSKDYVFDLDKFSSFEGRTGPYIQYTGARINSLLEKGGNKTGKISISLSEERNIIINLIKLYDSFTTSYNDNSLNSLSLALYNLASAYSHFYNNIKVLSEKDENKKISYLSLSKVVLKALTLGLNTLGIDMPKKM